MTDSLVAHSLDRLRAEYRECRTRNGGRCTDGTHSEALIQALEAELSSCQRSLGVVEARLKRSGTIYQVPRH